MLRRPSALFVFLLLVAAVVGSRARWLSHDIWNLDEGSTFTMAQQVLDGEVLYRDAADNRSPLVPYLKAAILRVAGDWNAFAVYTLLAVGLGVCAFLLYRLARQLDSPVAGWVAGLSFAAMQLLYIDSPDAMSTCTEWFVVIFSSIAFTLLIPALQAPRFRRGPLIGFCFALSLLCKQPGLLDFIVATVLVLLSLLPAAAPRKQLGQLWLGMILGVAVPMALTASYFALHGAWDDYIYYAFTFNTKLYLPEVPLVERLLCITRPFQMGWEHLPVFLVLGSIGTLGALGVGLFRLLRRRPTVPLMIWLTLGWIVSGLLTTTLSGRNFAHYSAQVLPGLSLALGWLFARIAAWRPARGVAPVRRVCVMAVLIVGGLALVANAGQRFAKVVPELDAAAADPDRVGPVVQRNSTPDERLFVWGYFPEIYFFGQRLPATRYIYTNYYTGMIAWTNLDALQDVSYAISPGARDKFYADLAAHPPAVIVDTGGQRGYTKFPLASEQPLWDTIQADFAQVETNTEMEFGMRLYRRLTPAPETPAQLDATAPTDQQLTLTGYFHLEAGQVPRLAVEGPRGYNHLELFINGTLHASLPYPASEKVNVRLFVPQPAADAPGPLSLQVRATGPAGTTLSEPFDFNAYLGRQRASRPREPALHIGSIEIAPTIANVPFTYLGRYSVEDGYWQISTPARLVYDCPSSIETISYVHGPNPGQMFKSDGYDVIVRWLPHDGAPITLSTRRMNPRQQGSDQVAQKETLALPPREAGQLEFIFGPGRRSDAQSDQLYFGQLKGIVGGAVIEMGDTAIFPITVSTPDNRTMKRTDEGTWIAHAPTSVSWPLPANLMAVEFSYGLDDRSFTGGDGAQTDGVEFNFDLVAPDGTRESLLHKWLRPNSNVDDRGPRSVRIDIPRHRTGRLEFSTGPGPQNDRSWDWAWVSDIRGFSPGPPIVINANRQIITTRTGGFADGWADRHDATHWSAQPPQELAYPKPADLIEVDFSYGLYDHALYDDQGKPRGNGVEAVVHFTDSKGKSIELYRRYIEPHQNPGDRGPQFATIKLPPGEAGSLHFHMEAGPNGDAGYDWAYWGPFTGKVAAPAN